MAQHVPFIVAELGRDADPFVLHLYRLGSEGAQEGLSRCGCGLTGRTSCQAVGLVLPQIVFISQLVNLTP
jgi:hypothetical protein